MHMPGDPVDQDIKPTLLTIHLSAQRIE